MCFCSNDVWIKRVPSRFWEVDSCRTMLICVTGLTSKVLDNEIRDGNCWTKEGIGGSVYIIRNWFKNGCGTPNTN